MKEHMEFLEKESYFITCEYYLILLADDIRKAMLERMYTGCDVLQSQFNEVYDAINQNRKEYQREKALIKSKESENCSTA